MEAKAVTAAMLEVSCAPVDWGEIRRAFLRERRRRRLTQQKVADRGHLHQSAVSKLETNVELGPAVEVFTKAVEGLGLPVSAFFAQLEGSQSSALKLPAASPQDRPQEGAGHVEEEQAVVAAAADKLADTLVAYVKRGMAAGDQPPAGARPARPKRRRRLRPRRRQSS